jgi:hypothetical protein
VASDDRAKHPSPGRIKRLLDRLAAILLGLPAERQQAFREYVDEQVTKEGSDDGRDAAEGDSGQR